MRYFFDTKIGKSETTDDTGCVFANPSDMRREAIRALTQIAAEEAVARRATKVMIAVRDESERPIFNTRLEITERWIINPDLSYLKYPR